MKHFSQAIYESEKQAADFQSIRQSGSRLLLRSRQKQKLSQGSMGHDEGFQAKLSAPLPCHLLNC